VLAGDVDEGSPLGVGEVYACLTLCCRNQVAHGTIVRWRTPASMPTGRYSPGGQKAAAKGELPRTPFGRSSQNSTSRHFVNKARDRSVVLLPEGRLFLNDCGRQALPVFASAS
jgi:hypothetical protein